MPRLLPGRRASTTAGGILLKKQSTTPRPNQPLPSPPQPPPDKEKDNLHKLVLTGNAAAAAAASAAAPTKPGAANVIKFLGNDVARKHIEAVLVKMEAMLPYATGVSLNALEADETMEQTKKILIKLAEEAVDLVMFQLFALIEKLQKKMDQPNFQDENIMDSQLYLLKVAAQALDTRWPLATASTFSSSSSHEIMARSVVSFDTSSPPYSSAGDYYSYPARPRAPSPRTSSSSLRSNSTAVSWVEPPALDESTVDYILRVLKPHLMSVGIDAPAGESNTTTNCNNEAEVEMFPWNVPEWEPSLALPERVKRSTAAARYHHHHQQQYHQPYASDQDAAGSPTAAVVPPGPWHKNPTLDPAREAWKNLIIYTHKEMEDQALHGSFFANVPVLIKKYAIRVVYHLSASNWTVIFNRFKATIHAAAAATVPTHVMMPLPSPAHAHAPVPGAPPYSPSKGRSDPRKSSRTVLPDVLLKASRSGTSLPSPKEEQHVDHQQVNGHSSASASYVPPAMAAAVDLDLRLLGLCLVDRTRLLAFLREINATFRDIPASLQAHAGVALRQAILNWVENFPHEFAELWSLYQDGPLQDEVSSPTVSIGSGSQRYQAVPTATMAVEAARRKMLEDMPERLFDTLFAYAKEAPKRLGTMYPMLAVLLCICPEKMDISHQVLEGLTNSSRSNNFLPSLEMALQGPSLGYSSTSSSVKLAEHAAYAYLDMLRLSFVLRNENPDDNMALQTMASFLVRGLKGYLLCLPGCRAPFWNSEDPIEVNFYVHAIVAIFRFDASAAVDDLILPCLKSDKSFAVADVAVKALSVIVVEGYKYPAQPSLEKFYPALTPRIHSHLASFFLQQPEIIDGVLQTASPVPYCKTLAMDKYDETREKMEAVRHTIHLGSLFCYDMRCLLFVLKGDDFNQLRMLSEMIVSPKRERIERFASILDLGLCYLQCAHATPGSLAYDQMISYVMNVTDLYMEIMSKLILPYWEEPEIARVAARVLHLILQVILNGPEFTKDNSWRFSQRFLDAYQLVEIALLSTIGCADLGILKPVLDSLRIISNLMRTPGAPIPSYLTEEDYHRRYGLFEALAESSSHAIIGNAILHKRIRRYVNLSTAATPVRMVVFRFYFEKFYKQLKTIHIALARQLADPDLQEQDLLDRNMLMEWKNSLFLIASGIRIDVDRSTDTRIGDVTKLLSKLPTFKNVSAVQLIMKYLNDVIELLDVNHIKVRDLAREALSVELNLRILPTFFNCLAEQVPRHLDAGPTYNADKAFIFTEQVLLVMKVLFDRLDGTLTTFDNSIPTMLKTISKQIDSFSIPGIKRQNLRNLYCNTVYLFLKKRDSFAIREENQFRHHICDLTVMWLKERLHNADDDPKFAFNSKMAALSLFVLAAENLVIDTADSTSDTPKSKRDQESSRQMGVLTEVNDYIETLMQTLPPDSVRKISDSTSNLDQLSDINDVLVANGSSIHDLVITGIAHILNKNSESAKNLCLAKLSDDNLRIRVIFMKVFTRILHQGARFNQAVAKAENKKDRLCQLVQDTPALSLSIVAACPQNRVEFVTPILVRMFETRSSLVIFMKGIIDMELSRTTDASELLRGSNLCTRLFSMFAVRHGYHYLRMIVRTLVEFVKQYPPESSFEFDLTSKLPEEDLRQNLERLTTVTQEFIKTLIATCNQVPLIIREICSYLANAVSLAFPSSKFAALGAFVFLRFLGPSIVAPDTVNVPLPEDYPNLRRALVNVTKLLQASQNRNSQGRDRLPHNLIPFIQLNSANINTFLTLIQNCKGPEEEPGMDLYPGPNEADALGLRKYIDTYSAIIIKDLLEPKNRQNGGKEVWDTVTTALADSRAALERPKEPKFIMAQHDAYRQFYEQNRLRKAETYEDLFRMRMTSEGPVLIIYFARIIVDIIDFDILLFAILQAVVTACQEGEFDVIFDFTGFTSRSHLPISWIRRAVELVPLDVQEKWRSAYIFNTNALAQTYLRKVLCVFKDFVLAKQMYTSIDDWGPLSSIVDELPLLDSFDAEEEIFENVHFRIEGYGWRLGTVIIGQDFARITSAKADDLSPSTSTRMVELINFHAVENIHRGDCSVLLRHYSGPSITFEHEDSYCLWKALMDLKNCATAENKASLLPASETSDTNAILFALGLLHACHPFEFVRGPAFELLTANCAYLSFPFDEYIPWRGGYIPSSSLTYIEPFSERLSRFAPHLALDFILEWCKSIQAFPKLSYAQKVDSLVYLAFWVPLLDRFAEPGSALFNECKLRNCIYYLVDITMDDPGTSPTTQRNIWMKVGGLRPFAMDIAIEKLTRIAIDYGLGSRKCDQAAEALMCIPSVHTQSKLLSDLRAAITAACNRSTKDIMTTDEWRTITVLLRVALVASHNAHLVQTNQLCAGEIAYVVSMLAGLGALAMRQSTHGMLMSLIQALIRTRTGNDIAIASLQRLQARLHDKQTLNLFGLDRPHPSADTILYRSLTEHIPSDSVQKIVTILMEILETGSLSVGCSNIWKVRWVSLVSDACFRQSSFSQRRGLIILGSLTTSKVEENVFLHLLLECKKGLLRPGYDDDAFASTLFCISKSVPGLPTNSKLLGFTFWFAVALLQAGPRPYFIELAKLIETVIHTMDKHGYFLNGLSVDLMEIRKPLHSVAVSIDKLSGLSFETDFGISLVMSLWNGMKTLPEKEQLLKTLLALLKLSVRHANPQGEARSQLDPLSMCFFLGLAPCFERASYCRLLQEECHIMGVGGTVRASSKEDHDSQDYEYGVKVEMLPLTPDTIRTTLVIDIMWVLETHPSLDVYCQENTTLMLEMLAQGFSVQHAQAVWFAVSTAADGYFPQRLENLFALSSKAHRRGFSHWINNAVARVPLNSITTPDVTPNTSSVSLADSVPPPPAAPAAHGRAVANAGMGGIYDIFKRTQRNEHENANSVLKEILKTTTRLLDLVIKNTTSTS